MCIFVAVVTDSTISDVIAKLMNKKSTHDPVEQPINRSDLIPRETRWTNQIQIEKAYLEVTAVFKSDDAPPAPDLTGNNHFVTEFKYGITRGKMMLTLLRGKIYLIHQSYFMSL
jgi:hypothetical protein